MSKPGKPPKPKKPKIPPRYRTGMCRTFGPDGVPSGYFPKQFPMRPATPAQETANVQ